MVSPTPDDPSPATGRRHRRRWVVPVVLVVAALAGAMIGVAVLDGDDDTTATAPQAPPATTGTTPPETPTGTETTGGGSPAPAATTTVPVYYLGDTENGLRLYREFARVSAPDGPVMAALDAMVTRPPADDDYSSLWPRQTTVRSVQTSGDVATVDLSREALDGRSGAEGEALSLQQLVHTVTAADPSIRGVRLLVEGKPVTDLWGHVEVGSGVLTRAPQTDVLAPVWIIEPADGARVGTDVRVTGTATVFEATVSWEVVQDEQVVQRGFATATEGAPGRGTWEARIRLDPGTYLLRAFESSAKDGQPMFVDDKEIVVG